MEYDGRKIGVMGIVNLTENSFYAPSRALASMDTLLDRIACMIREGANIIDLGACSTRPGSQPVGEEVELKRFSAVLPEICRAFPDVRLSIDTWWPNVVRSVVDIAGPIIVNDVTAAGQDCGYGCGDMLQTVSNLGLTYIAMHWAGDTSMKPSVSEKGDIVESVKEFFLRFSKRAEEAGLKDWWIDPGFGFSKTVEQNFRLLWGMDMLKKTFSRPLLVGVSRKSFITKTLDISSEDALAPTQVVHMVALQKGADCLRVHDPAEAVRTVRLYESIR